MNTPDLARLRLANQQVSRHDFAGLAETVAHLGALQGQDYAGSLWSLGLRHPGLTEAAAQQALEDRILVRSWSLRGTLHLMAAEDAAWIIALCGPRVIATCASMHRKLELDAKQFAQIAEAMARHLEGGRQLSRKELAEVIETAGISTQGLRLNHLIVHAAESGNICLGNRRGKEPQFAWLADWLPPTPTVSRAEALARLALRYFTSHGPAPLSEFANWAGLTLTDAREGLEPIKPKLEFILLDGQPYWMAPGTLPPVKSSAYLLPPFDEFILGYRDRSAQVRPQYQPRIVPSSNGLYSPVIVIDGQVVGTWRRSLAKKAVTIEFQPFQTLQPSHHKALAKEANRYAYFLGMDAILV